jgi:hypothetical protein
VNIGKYAVALALMILAACGGTSDDTFSPKNTNMGSSGILQAPPAAIENEATRPDPDGVRPEFPNSRDRASGTHSPESTSANSPKGGSSAFCNQQLACLPAT